MKTLYAELNKNFLEFSDELKTSYLKSFDDMDDYRDAYLQSYMRLSTLEAWRVFLIEQKIQDESLDFYLESQNDGLLSHCLARIGCWRSSLQSLRSAIENILFFLYYKDHPVEHELWKLGKNRLPISDYINYLSAHPKFLNVSSRINGIELLKTEYPTLSKAVHSSSESFRMTIGKKFPALMLSDPTRLKKGMSREKNVIKLINLLLLTEFSDDLTGAKLRDLRRSISIAIDHNLYSEISNTFGVKLFKP